jgi:hypothetical protein
MNSLMVAQRDRQDRESAEVRSQETMAAGHLLSRFLIILWIF